MNSLSVLSFLFLALNEWERKSFGTGRRRRRNRWGITTTYVEKERYRGKRETRTSRTHFSLKHNLLIKGDYLSKV
jgi:hypothetical protein